MNVVNSLNGNVHSQGIRIGHKAWLDMGSKEWEETSPENKAHAYQAAKLTGWTDKGLRQIILSEFRPRLDDFWADLIIDTLHSLEKEHPISITELKPITATTTFKN